MKISATVITYNEEQHILKCIDSLKQVADEIIVIDSYSTDRTKEICLQNKVNFHEHAFEGHIEQKNYAVSKAENDIILSLDGDEYLSEDLIQTIEDIKANWSADAYSFYRLSRFQNKWIRHCGWYPDKKIRLFDRRKGRWGGYNPHDTVVMGNNSDIVTVKKDILHCPYDSISDYITKTNTFSSILADSAYKKGKKSTILFHVVLKPIYTFIEKYIIRLGILDGFQGFVISIISSFGKFLQYLKLYQLNRSNR